MKKVILEKAKQLLRLFSFNGMSKVIMSRRIKVEPPKFSMDMTVSSFAEKRNKILVIRSVGGLGDIFMHRMMFEDFKILMPDCEMHFACPKIYHDAISDHPFVDLVLDSEFINKNDYIVSYNTSSACTRYEMKMSPISDKNRSDIWANHCGLNLTRHAMHINLTPEEQKWGIDKLESFRQKNNFLLTIAPVSAMTNKNLTDQQLSDLLKGLIDRNITPVGLHNNPIFSFSKLGLPTIYKINIREWMSVLAASDGVLAVDTAAFHCSGGMGVPVIGVFTFCNGDTYSKYYKNSIVTQGPCPVEKQGCYNWCNCPVKRPNGLLPCCENLNVNEILNCIDKMIIKLRSDSIVDT